jgi:hypothetical protein
MNIKIGKIAFLSSVIGLCTATSVIAASIKELQGAWTMDGTQCTDTFKKVGNKIEFKDRTASTSTGLLVTGSRIAGPNAACTTQSVRKQKDRLSANLTCVDSMMENSQTVTFKIVDSQTFERFDPFGDNMYITYHKCDL